MVHRADYSITRLMGKVSTAKSDVVLGHSRLITNGLADNQPVVRDEVVVLHNGIVVNHEAVWKSLRQKQQLEIDTEVIAAIAIEHLQDGGDVATLPARVLELCEGLLPARLLYPGSENCACSRTMAAFMSQEGRRTCLRVGEFPLDRNRVCRCRASHGRGFRRPANF